MSSGLASVLEDESDLHALALIDIAAWQRDGVPDERQQYVTGMREAARAVENAEDIDAARAAAKEISRHCQGCHTAAGVITAE